ncbi:MAG: NAD(+) synthase [Acidobacteria bacterium]|nr:NAD(+) synthase [Acidobacteriota bacterium]
MPRSFHSIYAHGFVRVAVATPFLRVADPSYNLERTIGLAHRASSEGAALVLFPELGISAYTCDDLFHQESLLEATELAVAKLTAVSRELRSVLIVGAPLRFEGRLFNCAVLIHHGHVLGLVPKTYLPNYREFYEKRQFSSARDLIQGTVRLNGETVPIGNDLLFESANIDNFTIHAEICEDLWTPIPPSTYAALAGATVLVNLSASNATIGKGDYRRNLCAAHSGKCIAAYLYSAAGPGESTTDLAWDGQAIVYENNELLAESERFSTEEQLIFADVDLERLIQDRMRLTSFNDSIGDHLPRLQQLRRIGFSLDLPDGPVSLIRRVERYPYVPDDERVRDERCFEAYNIQVHGLKKRIQATGIDRIIIGVSGGLDSTQALIVAARTMDQLGLPRRNIFGYTMPGFATSRTTLTNAHALMDALGVTSTELDIRPSCQQMLHDLGHPFSEGQPVYDITFENVQAGERTSHLFRLANYHQGLVLGTGDLSELALGWTTYGVGDHMSHYNVNASVPKTLIQYLLRWAITTNQFDNQTSAVLRSILATEISPELIPGDAQGSERPAQSTEAHVGPYELQDFNLYYISRFGFRPGKVAYLALNAWGEKYDLTTICRWLEVFLDRFFGKSQFKRSCVPNSPKVGSGGSLSPRGDWRAPSDSAPRVWLDDLHRITD